MTQKHTKTALQGRIKRELTGGTAARSNPTKAKAPVLGTTEAFR